jgi:hypothetical protein
MHPFLDVTKLTDEEIISRLSRAYTYMNTQVGLGHNPTVTSIKEVIESLENERRERQLRTSDNEFNKKYPNSHKPLELGKLED